VKKESDEKSDNDKKEIKKESSSKNKEYKSIDEIKSEKM